jgi:hypothetical protein
MSTASTVLVRDDGIRSVESISRSTDASGGPGPDVRHSCDRLSSIRP